MSYAAKEWLSEYASSKEWLRHKNLSDSTIRRYYSSLMAYCEFRGMDPDGLSKEVERMGREKAIKEVPGFLADYQEHLKEQTLPDGTKYADGTIKGHVTALMSYYSTVLGTRLIVSIKVNPKRKKVKSHIPERTEMRRILSYCSLREKAPILFQYTTGMRIGDMLSLRIKHVEALMEETVDYIPLTYLAEKTGKHTGECTTVIPPCTVDVMRQYLHMREMAGEELGPDTPLFTSNKSTGKPITSVQINNILRAAVKKSEIISKMKESQGYKVSSHQLRAAFCNCLKHGGMNPEYVEHMMGHTSFDPYNGAYERFPPHMLVNAYKEHINCIDPFFDEEKEEALHQVKIYTEEVSDLKEQMKTLETRQVSHELSSPLSMLFGEAMETQLVHDAADLEEYKNKGWTCVPVWGGKKQLLFRPIGGECSGTND